MHSPHFSTGAGLKTLDLLCTGFSTRLYNVLLSGKRAEASHTNIQDPVPETTDYADLAGTRKGQIYHNTQPPPKLQEHPHVYKPTSTHVHARTHTDTKHAKTKNKHLKMTHNHESISPSPTHSCSSERWHSIGHCSFDV